MHIAFIHNQLAFLPEIVAYERFFAASGISCEVIRPRDLQRIQPDVAWHFMGIDRMKEAPVKLTIHEYTSASVRPFAALKDRYKRMFNTKPDYRLFLNKFVENAMGFHDNVPSGIRDMGIPADWLHQSPNKAKTYDFIYVGEWKNRRIERLLELFATGNMSKQSILVVSKDLAELKRRYQSYSNIHFEGPVLHERIPGFIAQAKFGINFMPDVPPFNQQTSTKLLEYAACGVPVITTDYLWVRDFQQRYRGNFFFLSKDLSNFTWDQVQAFPYSFPDMRSFTWDQQITASGIPAFLKQRFPGISLTNS